jgi:hypothetical protein
MSRFLAVWPSCGGVIFILRDRRKVQGMCQAICWLLPRSTLSEGALFHERRRRREDGLQGLGVLRLHRLASIGLGKWTKGANAHSRIRCTFWPDLVPRRDPRPRSAIQLPRAVQVVAPVVATEDNDARHAMRLNARGRSGHRSPPRRSGHRARSDRPQTAPLPKAAGWP